MDPLIAFLLVVIVLSSGVIGMLADSLGRKLGKKKLSFRSMRPKHVARLGTFIAGMLVSVVTLLMVFFTSSDVREWIIRGRAALAESRKLESQNQSLKSEITNRSQRIDVLDSAMHSAETKLMVAQNRLSSIEKELAQLRTGYAEAKARYAAAQTALKLGQHQLAESEKKLAANQTLMAMRQRELARISKNLTEARQRYTILSRNYAEVDRERTEANEKVVELNRQADQLKADMAGLNADKLRLAKDKQTALEELAATQSKMADTSEELLSKKEELDKANTELDGVKQEIMKLGPVAAESRLRPLIFQKDQEIARIKVPAHMTRAQANDAINRLIRDASRAAQARGATPLRSGEYTVGFWPQTLPSNEVFSADAQREAELDQLTNYHSDVVLIAQAYLNAFKGEFVPIKIFGYNDPVVFRKGEVMAELHVEKNTPREKVLTQLNDFMRETVHNSAIHRGMIPVSGADGDLLVDMEPAQTLDLVDELANSVRNVRLQIIARTETRAADSLQLDFLIK